MTYGQAGAACPQCGSAANVHSISELAALAQDQLNRQPPGFQTGPQPGNAGPAQQGQTPGWAADPVPHSGPTPGWAAQPVPHSGPNYGTRRRDTNYGDYSGGDIASGLEGDIAGLALGAAAKFIGRRIGQRVQQKLSDQVLPNLAAKREEILRNQIAIADRHPDLRACLSDKVVFLAGGNRVLPMPDLSGPLTVEQSDQLVDRLRNG